MKVVINILQNNSAIKNCQILVTKIVCSMSDAASDSSSNLKTFHTAVEFSLKKLGKPELELMRDQSIMF